VICIMFSAIRPIFRGPSHRAVLHGKTASLHDSKLQLVKNLSLVNDQMSGLFEAELTFVFLAMKQILKPIEATSLVV
jgi:hypothetical protein